LRLKDWYESVEIKWLSNDTFEQNPAHEELKFPSIAVFQHVSTTPTGTELCLSNLVVHALGICKKNMVLQQILNLLNQEGAAQILGSTDEECCEAAN